MCCCLDSLHRQKLIIDEEEREEKDTTRKLYGQYWTVRSMKGDNSSSGYLSGGVRDKAKAENCRSIFDIDRHYQGQPDTATR